MYTNDRGEFKTLSRKRGERGFPVSSRGSGGTNVHLSRVIIDDEYLYNGVRSIYVPVLSPFFVVSFFFFFLFEGCARMKE